MNISKTPKYLFENEIMQFKSFNNDFTETIFNELDEISKELELGTLHCAKIEGITIKRTLSVLMNTKKYYTNATKIFKKEIVRHKMDEKFTF